MIEFDPLNQPPGTLQMQSLTVSGLEFGTNFTSATTGCPYPPCARILKSNGNPTNLMDTTPPITPVFMPGQLSFRFVWKTDCNQIIENPDCKTLSSEYHFLLRVTDNFCPTPSVAYSTLSFLIKDFDPGAAKMKCIQRDPNGHMQLTFLPPTDIGTLDTLPHINGFNVYRSLNGLNGPFQFLDSIYGFNINNPDTILTYTDTMPGTISGTVSYFLSTRAGCRNVEFSYSDTISFIHLTGSANASGASLNWNQPLQLMSSTSSSNYQIYYEQPAGSGNWALLDSTGSVQYQHTLPTGPDTLRYYVTLTDSAGGPCISSSDTLLLAVYPGVMIEEIRHLSDIDVYPNPGNGNFTLKSKTSLPLPMKLNILDAEGHLLRTLNHLQPDSDGSVKVQLPELKSGFYLFQFEENGYRSYRKVLIIRSTE